MLAMPGMRSFSLAATREGGGVSCDVDGVFVYPMFPAAKPPESCIRREARLSRCKVGMTVPRKKCLRGSPGFDGLTLSHVEGHAAALMRQQGNMEGTLYINNPKICGSCTRLLPTMLPPGAVLNVVLPDDSVVQFTGIGP